MWNFNFPKRFLIYFSDNLQIHFFDFFFPSFYLSLNASFSYLFKGSPSALIIFSYIRCPIPFLIGNSIGFGSSKRGDRSVRRSWNRFFLEIFEIFELQGFFIDSVSLSSSREKMLVVILFYFSE